MLRTEIEIDPSRWSPADLEPAVAWLRAGKVVAFPTDTLYGLAVDPASETAVKTLFQLKGRETSVALPLVAASRAQVDAWCGLGGTARRLDPPAEPARPGLHLHILDSRSISNRKLISTAGAEWVIQYDGELTDEALTAAVAAAEAIPAGARPRLEGRDWDEVGRRHRDVYRSAIAKRRGKAE